MLLYRRVFQNFESNRLRRHQFFYITQYKRREVCYNNNTGIKCQFIRSKSDINTHNNPNQTHLNSADDYIQQIPKQNLFESNKTLPFHAIPSADTSNTGSISSLIAFAHQFKQLLTSKWDNRFHEEIDGYHRKLGPIFCKSLAPGVNGELYSQ